MIKSVLLFVVFLNFVASMLVMGKEGRSIRNRLFCALSICASLWAFSNYLTLLFHSVFWLQASYASSVVVVGSGLIWVLYIAHLNISKLEASAIAGISFLLSMACFLPSFIAKRYDAVYVGEVFRGEPRYGLFIYVTVCVLAAGIMLYSLFRAQRRETDQKRKLQLQYIFAAIVFLVILSLVTYSILPTLSIYKLGAIPCIAFLLFLVTVGYSILRHEVLDPKIIAAEFTILSLWAFMLIEVFAEETMSGQVMSLLLFFIAVAAGIQLRRSLALQLAQKEMIEKNRTELLRVNEQLRELNIIKTEFLSFATHQIKSPLAVISGYAEMFREGAAGRISAKQKEIICSLEGAAKHLSSTVDDFLNVAKIEQGGLLYEMETFNYGEMVRMVVDTCMITASRKGLMLSYIEDEGGPYHVHGDRHKLRQVIYNILDNAIKYTKEGSVTVQVGSRDASNITCSVSDTGIGIAPEFVGHLFEKFARGGGHSSAATGSGLGLYLAKTILTGHGGTIEVWSEGSQKGSTFVIVLKRKSHE